MRGIGMALLAILIPLAIAILSNYYQKKDDKTKAFEILDLHVILDGVFKFKWLLIYVASIFLPTMFWDTFSSRESHLIETILSVAGAYLVVKTLLDIYRWVKGNPSEFRFSYLRNLKTPDDMEAAWRSVWQAEKTGTYDEKEFFKIFSLKIDQLLKTSEKFETTTKLLEDFSDFINNRSSVVLVSVMFHKILVWHYETWKLKNRYIIHDILGGIVNKIKERALKKYSFSFFNDLKKHSEAHENEKEYLEYFFTIFFRDFFENIESVPVEERYSIWEHHFPPEWKVTKETLDKNIFVSRISLSEFLNWAQGRIVNPKGEFDKELANITSNLFPEVEPTVWASILIFRLSPWVGNDRIKSVIEHPWNFGKSRVYRGSGEEPNLFETMESQIESGKKNTFELATMLFKDTFSKENLAHYIEDLKKLKYGDESLEEEKRTILLGLFTDMLKFLEAS